MPVNKKDVFLKYMTLVTFHFNLIQNKKETIILITFREALYNIKYSSGEQFLIPLDKHIQSVFPSFCVSAASQI